MRYYKRVNYVWCARVWLPVDTSRYRTRVLCWIIVFILNRYRTTINFLRLNTIRFFFFANFYQYSFKFDFSLPQRLHYYHYNARMQYWIRFECIKSELVVAIYKQYINNFIYETVSGLKFVHFRISNNQQCIKCIICYFF